jgi:hypothetical protein
MRMRRIVICGLALSTFFPNLLTKGTIFEKKVTEHKMFMIFPTSFFQNISPSNKNSARRYHKCTQVLCKVSVIRVRYPKKKKKKLEFSRHIFEKSPYITSHKNPSIGSRVVACRRTDGQT